MLKGPDVAVSRATDQQFVFLGHGRKATAAPIGGLHDGHTDQTGGWALGYIGHRVRKRRRSPCPGGHEDSVLIVIAPAGFYGDRLPADESARAREALDRMVWLAGVAVRLGIPAVITEEDPKRNGPTSPAIAERLGQASALIKPTFGLTGTPEIVQAVEETGRKTAVLVGFETDVCVAQSAMGCASGACAWWCRMTPCTRLARCTPAASRG